MRVPVSADDLAERLFSASLGMLDLMNIYLGHRLGYYRALHDAPAGLTPRELASAARTDTRYAREWLQQQGASGFVQLVSRSEDSDDYRFVLPPAYAEVLLDQTSTNYLVPIPEMLIGAAKKAPEVIEAHSSGGGVSWSDFGDEIRRSQVAFNRPMFMQLLGREYLPSIPWLHNRLLQGRPARIADIACGGGWSSIALALAYPNAEVHGFDIDRPSIEIAVENARNEGVSERVSFHHADAAEIEGEFDLVLICEALHDMPRPVPVLRAAKKAAAPGGMVIVMDEGVAEEYEAPGNDVDRLMLGISNWICLPDSMSSQPSVATGTAMRPSTLRKYAGEAGFKGVDYLPIENDFFRFYHLRP